MIPLWIEDGWDARKIAAQIGTTAESLKTVCSRKGISLCIGAKPIGPITLPQSSARKLAEIARARNVTLARLCFDLLVLVADDNLAKAILDDDEDATDQAVS